MKKGLVTALIGAAAYCAGALFLPWQSFELAQIDVRALDVHGLAGVFVALALLLAGVAGWGLATGRRVAAARAVLAGGLVLVAWLVTAQLNREWGLTLMPHETVSMGLGFVLALAGALTLFGGAASALALAPHWDEATPVLRVRALPSDAHEPPRELIVYEPRAIDLARELGLDAGSHLARAIGDIHQLRLTAECELRLELAHATRAALEGSARRVSHSANDSIVLAIGDRAAVDLGLAELRFDYVRQQRQGARQLVRGSEAVGFALVVLLVFLALGVGTILGWDEDARRLLPDDERRTATIAALTEDEHVVDPEVPTTIETALVESSHSSKAAGGPEGKFGDPEAPPDRPTKVPPRDGAPVKRAFDVQKTGIIAQLTDPNRSLALTEILTNDGAFAARVQSATVGNDDTWALGPGTNGLGIVGDDEGGPGNDTGRMLAQGTIDTNPGDARVAVQLAPKPPRKVRDLPPTTGTVSGEFCKKGEIASAVVRRQFLIRTCYEQRLQVVDGLRGKVTVRWMIGLDGGVLSADAVGDTLGDTATTQCVLRAVRKIKFAAPDGGTCVVSWPFVFSPG